MNKISICTCRDFLFRQFLVSETWCHSEVQVVLKLSSACPRIHYIRIGLSLIVILLPQPPEC